MMMQKPKVMDNRSNTIPEPTWIEMGEAWYLTLFQTIFFFGLLLMAGGLPINTSIIIAPAQDCKQGLEYVTVHFVWFALVIANFSDCFAGINIGEKLWGKRMYNI